MFTGIVLIVVAVGLYIWLGNKIFSSKLEGGSAYYVLKFVELICSVIGGIGALRIFLYILADGFGQ